MNADTLIFKKMTRILLDGGVSFSILINSQTLIQEECSF